MDLLWHSSALTRIIIAVVPELTHVVLRLKRSLRGHSNLKTQQVYDCGSSVTSSRKAIAIFPHKFSSVKCSPSLKVAFLPPFEALETEKVLPALGLLDFDFAKLDFNSGGQVRVRDLGGVFLLEIVEELFVVG
jgi:hypothetical protein